MTLSRTYCQSRFGRILVSRQNEADKQAQKDGIMPLSLPHDGGAHFLPAVEAVIAGKIIVKAKSYIICNW